LFLILCGQRFRHCSAKWRIAAKATTFFFNRRNDRQIGGQSALDPRIGRVESDLDLVIDHAADDRSAGLISMTEPLKSSPGNASKVMLTV